MDVANRFAQAWARLTGSSSLTPPAAGADNGGEGGAATGTVTLTKAQADQLDVEVAADITAARAEGKAEGVKEGHAAGFKEANERWTTVLNSEAGKANPAAAITLLGNDKLTAEEITAMLPTLGTAARRPAGAPESHLDRTVPLDLAPDNDGDEDAGAEGGRDQGNAASAKRSWGTAFGKVSALAEGGHGEMRGAIMPGQQRA